LSDLPKARKPGDGEPSGTEPVPLAGAQGRQNTHAMSLSSSTSMARLS
jgi:hypothetical protein